ncbi:gas vesicle protein GvpO [Streptomyces melanogenes]|uniref:gas vesicle protein GvpO n=1 Tax=Streptomyces melanogenes TaxID=67326 RepID=UPI00167D59C6|nr:gas vesicle protein [Streptomyces melanogenes]GGP45691.1 gas vesicle protein [Streptomyces melanogenes]
MANTSENTSGGKRHSREELPGPMDVLRGARAQLAELTGMTAESVSSFERGEDGWVLRIEVLELARVPDTMSLLASYEVELDRHGELTGYRRLRRYERGRADRTP